MTHLLIGIAGKPRSGKDTAAALLEEYFPGIYRTTYSHAIAEEYDALHGTTTRHNEEEKVKHRHGFAELGNTRRAEDPHYWNKKVLTHDGPLLVTGVRGVAEAEAIKERGGVLILVTTSQQVLQERMGEHFHNATHHSAEHHLDSFTGWDFVIENNGSLEDLENTVMDLVVKIKKKFPVPSNFSTK